MLEFFINVLWFLVVYLYFLAIQWILFKKMSLSASSYISISLESVIGALWVFFGGVIFP